MFFFNQYKIVHMGIPCNKIIFLDIGGVLLSNGWGHESREAAAAKFGYDYTEMNDYRVEKFRLHDCFDAFISSCEVGMRKPDPGIFRLAMGIAQASPEDCIYFDDRQILVDAATKTGMTCYRHKGLDSTREILE